jgi:hypothetical protein
MNRYWIIYISKRFIPCDKILTLYFFINIFKNKIDSCSIMDTVGHRAQLNKLETFITLTSVLSQDLDL